MNLIWPILRFHVGLPDRGLAPAEVFLIWRETPTQAAACPHHS